MAVNNMFAVGPTEEEKQKQLEQAQQQNTPVQQTVPVQQMPTDNSNGYNYAQFQQQNVNVNDAAQTQYLEAMRTAGGFTAAPGAEKGYRVDIKPPSETDIAFDAILATGLGMLLNPVAGVFLGFAAYNDGKNKQHRASQIDEMRRLGVGEDAIRGFYETGDRTYIAESLNKARDREKEMYDRMTKEEQQNYDRMVEATKYNADLYHKGNVATETQRSNKVSEAIQWKNADTSRYNAETSRGTLDLAKQKYADEKGATPEEMPYLKKEGNVHLKLNRNGGYDVISGEEYNDLSGANDFQVGQTLKDIPAAKLQKATGEDKKIVRFTGQGIEAEKALMELLESYDPTTLSSFVQGKLPEIVKGEKRKKFEAMGESVSNMKLRLDTGAAYNGIEKADADKMMPQAGDSKSVALYRASKRLDLYEKSLMGSGYIKYGEKELNELREGYDRVAAKFGMDRYGNPLKKTTPTYSGSVDNTQSAPATSYGAKYGY